MINEHDELDICCDDRAYDMLLAAAKYLGWSVVIPETGSDDVPGLVIGTEDFLRTVFGEIQEIPAPGSGELN